jgi:hypothetical protein
MMRLLYGLIGFFFFVAIWVVVNRVRLRILRRQRQANGFGRDQFIEAFRQLGIPDNIPSTVYDYYGSRKAWKDFPFSPDDKYSEVLHDDPDDLDDDGSALVRQLGIILPTEHTLREYGHEPIKSLRDMVLWLDWVRRHQPRASEANVSENRSQSATPDSK